MKILLLALVVITLAGCASKQETTAQAEENLRQSWTPKVGTATKGQFVEQLGTPQWCHKEDWGGETCSFYDKKGTVWKGDPKDRKSYNQYDLVTAVFDPAGLLRSFDVQAQR